MAAFASASASRMRSSPPSGTNSSRGSTSRSPRAVDTTLDRFNLVFDGIPEADWSVNAADPDAQQVRRVAMPEFCSRPRQVNRRLALWSLSHMGPRWSSAIGSLTTPTRAHGTPRDSSMTSVTDQLTLGAAPSVTSRAVVAIQTDRLTRACVAGAAIGFVPSCCCCGTSACDRCGG